MGYQPILCPRRVFHVSFWKLKTRTYSIRTERVRESLQVLALLVPGILPNTTLLCWGPAAKPSCVEAPCLSMGEAAGGEKCSVVQPLSVQLPQHLLSFLAQDTSAAWSYNGHSQQKPDIPCYFCSCLPEQTAPVLQRSTFLMKQLWDQCCMTSKSKTVYN